MKMNITAGQIPSANSSDKRFVVPTILANRHSATFVFWKWMLTLQWSNFD